MNRRTFLKSLAAALAASAVPAPVGAILDPPPVVDWNTWNFIELKSGLAGVSARINGQDITRFPALLAEVRKYIRVDKDHVAFGPGGVTDKGGGFRMMVPDLDSPRDVVACCNLRLRSEHHEYSSMTDILVTNGDAKIDGLVFCDIKHPTPIEGVQIVGIGPN